MFETIIVTFLEFGGFQTPQAAGLQYREATAKQLQHNTTRAKIFNLPKCTDFFVQFLNYLSTAPPYLHIKEGGYFNSEAPEGKLRLRLLPNKPATSFMTNCMLPPVSSLWGVWGAAQVRVQNAGIYLHPLGGYTPPL